MTSRKISTCARGSSLRNRSPRRTK
jgi:hypothetical protein